MNTPRLSDIMPATALSNAPAGMRPMSPAERPQVPATRESSQGGAGVPDGARRRVDEERQRIDPFSSADENASRAEAQARAEPRIGKRVGYFDGSTIIFVDLVDQKTQRELLRIFGPSQPPKGDPKDPEEASRAYETASGNRRREQSTGLSA
ncbi:MAG: hypothetical protein ACO3DJ_11435 [Alphaproteobacteria bacterium]|jgi:hypothetical protein